MNKRYSDIRIYQYCIIDTANQTCIRTIRRLNTIWTHDHPIDSARFPLSNDICEFYLRSIYDHWRKTKRFFFVSLDTIKRVYTDM